MQNSSHPSAQGQTQTYFEQHQVGVASGIPVRTNSDRDASFESPIDNTGNANSISPQRRRVKSRPDLHEESDHGLPASVGDSTPHVSAGLFTSESPEHSERKKKSNRTLNPLRVSAGSPEQLPNVPHLPSVHNPTPPLPPESTEDGTKCGLSLCFCKSKRSEDDSDGEVPVTALPVWLEKRSEF